MKMAPQTRENYIRAMKMNIMAIESVLAEYKRDQSNFNDANIRAFKEIKEICERQITMKSMGAPHTKK